MHLKLIVLVALLAVGSGCKLTEKLLYDKSAGPVIQEVQPDGTTRPVQTITYTPKPMIKTSVEALGMLGPGGALAGAGISSLLTGIGGWMSAKKRGRRVGAALVESTQVALQELEANPNVQQERVAAVKEGMKAVQHGAGVLVEIQKLLAQARLAK